MSYSGLDHPPCDGVGIIRQMLDLPNPNLPPLAHDTLALIASIANIYLVTKTSVSAIE